MYPCPTMVGKAIQFTKEAVAELKKSTWSGKREVAGATAVVLALTGLVAIYVGAVDFVLSKILGFLLR